MAPRDPNVQLPRGVKARVDEGERIFQQAYGQRLNEEIAPEENDPPPPVEEPDEGPIRPPVQPPPFQPKPMQAETSTQTELSEQPHTQPPPPASWEQRYKTLEGRHKADATAHRKQMGELSARIDEQTKALMEGSRVIAGMQDEIRQLRTVPPPPPKSVKPVEIDFELTTEEREQWSPDFLNVVKRAAGAVVSAQLQAKEQEITGLRSELALLGKRVQDVGANTEQNSLQTFLNNMTLALPDWEAQNTDDNFIEWLEQPDGYSQISRKISLDKAVEQRNVSAAVRIFQGYRAELEAPNPTPPAISKPNGTGTQQGGNGRVRLESLAAPRTTRQQPQSSQEAPLPPTPVEIQRFTQDVTKGRFKGRDAERVAFQKRIDDLARASVRLAAKGNPY